MTQSIKRHSQWRSNLCGFLASVSRQKFRPGSHDCALFAAGAVQAMTGADLASDYAGRYRTVAEGMALLRSQGVVDLTALVIRHFEEIPPLKAGVGDLALVQGEGGEDALGVVQGPSIFVLQRNGLGRVSLEAGLKGFRV
ncbi:hypothetical protein PhaeoP24_04233 (plasmid) [Phaeobacter inhibens]|uniref:DUF6950 family protein n=1 Tax=Phaeobacter inhibens TaxID=221822 RepID=UPI000CA2C0BB|nr:hypothetical protein PhaeoP24_04233 [Phaeobacter inhibens]